MFESRTYGHRGWLIWIVARDIPSGGCFARAGVVADFILFFICTPFLFTYWCVSIGLTGEVMVGF